MATLHLPAWQSPRGPTRPSAFLPAATHAKIAGVVTGAMSVVGDAAAAAVCRGRRPARPRAVVATRTGGVALALAVGAASVLSTVTAAGNAAVPVTVDNHANVSRARRQALGLRVCFLEEEASTQCQGARNTCSGWSSSPSWTQPFRDDTDGRAGGCAYRWQLQGAAAPNTVYRICFLEEEASTQCQGARNTCSGWSTSPSWTQPFRDDTDHRAGGCAYRWQIQQQAQTGVPPQMCQVCFLEEEASTQCQGARNTCSGFNTNPSWTQPFRDDTDGRAGGCAYRWRLNCQAAPTSQPTPAPTPQPTPQPTQNPTGAPTVRPTNAPTGHPCETGQHACDAASTYCTTDLGPQFGPTLGQGSSRYACACAANRGFVVRLSSTSCGTAALTFAPTVPPTELPTNAPTVPPTLAPTYAPSLPPTDAPTVAPTVSPTVSPTAAPTPSPASAARNMDAGSGGGGGKDNLLLIIIVVVLVVVAVVFAAVVGLRRNSGSGAAAVTGGGGGGGGAGFGVANPMYEASPPADGRGSTEPPLYATNDNDGYMDVDMDVQGKEVTSIDEMNFE